MKLEKIIAIADKVYPSGLVKQAFESKGGCSGGYSHVGDGLAEFIARELTDTYDEKATSLEQLWEANRVMARAHCEIGAVDMAFEDAVERYTAKATTPANRPKRRLK